ncbi:hypothetical protein HK097_000706, partial [Rhizophlyctis rosea]
MVEAIRRTEWLQNDLKAEQERSADLSRQIKAFEEAERVRMDKIEELMREGERVKEDFR